MCKLRVLSWNIRTFGVPPPRDVTVRNLVELMVQSRADIICIQEIQCGHDVGPRIGAEVSAAINTEVGRIYQGLQAADAGAEWRWSLSRVNNSGMSDSMRDAYGFFWKAHPAGSAHTHDDPLATIIALGDPAILRQEGQDHFPGRRPGMVTFDLISRNGRPATLNVISWHAPTPCNTTSKYGQPSAGRGIIELATLSEIGGDAPRFRDGEWQFEPIRDLPSVDTIVLGDFNYSMGAPNDRWVYTNLLTNYQPCVSNPDDIRITTYSVDPTKPFSGKSSYDNIFVLRSHPRFEGRVTFDGTAEVRDFIADKARELGEASGIQFFADHAAWYVIYLEHYKRQYGVAGLSDHLPVCADFRITGGNADTHRVKPTDGGDYNSLMHATFGKMRDGRHYDRFARSRRDDLAKWILQIDYPMFQRVRQALLLAMIQVFEDDPTRAGDLQFLYENEDEDAYHDPAYQVAHQDYVETIRSERPLLPPEAELLAFQKMITIVLIRVEDGEYRDYPLNPGLEVHNVYHIGVHFFYYDAS